MTTADLRLSKSLNDIASMVDRVICKIAGVARCPFVLIAQPALNAQYVSNVSREDGVKLLQGLLARWGNPASKADLAEHQKNEIIDSLSKGLRSSLEINEALFGHVFDILPSDERMQAVRKRVAEVTATTKAVLAGVEAQLAAAREINAEGGMQAPPMEDRH